jgi:hypothetical protein
LEWRGNLEIQGYHEAAAVPTITTITRNSIPYSLYISIKMTAVLVQYRRRPS